MILAKIAWRNIWRNRRRSWVLILAVAFSVFTYVGMLAYMDGLMVEMLDTTIDLQGGHVLVAADGYHENPTIRAHVDDAERVAQVLDGLPGLRYAPFVTTPGMANSAEQAAGVLINGVDPAREGGVTMIGEAIVEGEYLPESGAAIVVGAALADRLDVRLGEKLVLMANDLDNEVSAGAFRVVGFYRTSSSSFDRANVYIPLPEAQALVGYGQQVTAFTLRLEDGADVDEAAARVEAALGDAGLEVLSWRARFPFLVLTLDVYDYSVVILAVILFLAVAFTIINSFLMVIFERIREIGIMMAGGVRPRQVRAMLYLEAFFMLLLGTALGGTAAALLIGIWGRVGLDLSAFSEGLGVLGVGPIIYPHLDPFRLAIGFIVIVVMVGLAVVYPAYKASRFELVEAIHYV